MIGAQNARMDVKNQCRTKTTSSVFLVSVHVCEKKPAMVAVRPVVGYQDEVKAVYEQRRSRLVLRLLYRVRINGRNTAACSPSLVSTRKSQSGSLQKDGKE